jgi:hypothetical protein
MGKADSPVRMGNTFQSGLAGGDLGSARQGGHCGDHGEKLAAVTKEKPMAKIVCTRSRRPLTTKPDAFKAPAKQAPAQPQPTPSNAGPR